MTFSTPPVRGNGQELAVPHAAAPKVHAAYTRRGYAMVAVAAGMWGTWSLFLRPAERISPLDPALEALLMFATMTAFALPIALRERHRVAKEALAERARITYARKNVVLMLALGAADAANVACFFLAMQKGSLAVAVLCHYLAPLFIASAAPFALGERARFPAGAMALALSGLALLVWPGEAPRGDVVASAMWGAASAVFYALTTLLNKKLERVYSASELLAYHSIAAMIVLAPFALFGQGGAPKALAYVIGGSVLLSAGGGLVYLHGLRRVLASRAAVLTLLEPVVALFVGAFVWGESTPLRGWLGAVLVLAGAYLVLKPSSSAISVIADSTSGAANSQ